MSEFYFFLDFAELAIAEKMSHSAGIRLDQNLIDYIQSLKAELEAERKNRDIDSEINQEEVRALKEAIEMAKSELMSKSLKIDELNKELSRGKESTEKLKVQLKETWSKYNSLKKDFSSEAKKYYIKGLKKQSDNLESLRQYNSKLKTEKTSLRAKVEKCENQIKTNGNDYRKDLSDLKEASETKQRDLLQKVEDLEKKCQHYEYQVNEMSKYLLDNCLKDSPQNNPNITDFINSVNELEEQQKKLEICLLSSKLRKIEPKNDEEEDTIEMIEPLKNEVMVKSQEVIACQTENVKLLHEIDSLKNERDNLKSNFVFMMKNFVKSIPE